MTLRISALALGLLLSVAASIAGSEAPVGTAEPYAQAPSTFEARFETSKGAFVIEVNRAWAPLAADRFYNLVKIGYYDNVRFYPVVPGYALQFGIHSGPPVSAKWMDEKLQGEPAKESNKAGFVSFAKGSDSSVGTQVFISLSDNSRLDSQGFAPFGRVTEGMDVVAKLNAEYAASMTSYQGSQSGSKLDFISKASVVDEPAEGSK